MKYLGLLLLFTLFTRSVFAVTIQEAQDVVLRLNNEFTNQVLESGYKEVEFFEELKAQDYPGGVNIVDNKIRIIVGSRMVAQFSSGALRFISCHELGHILGGEPYKKNKYGVTRTHILLSTEGQSDYWAGGECLRRISTTPAQDALEFFTFMAQSLKDIVGDNPFYQAPSIGGIDEHYYEGEYPSFQCRLNTVIAGLEGRPRPGCWYISPSEGTLFKLHLDGNQASDLIRVNPQSSPSIIAAGVYLSFFGKKE